MKWICRSLVATAVFAGACDVPERSAGTGGIDLRGAGGIPAAAGGRAGASGAPTMADQGGAAGEGFEPPGCGRGFVVISSDYQSSSVALLGLDGEVLSGSFISSGSELPGLSSALTGDVVAPTMPAGDEVLLIDRYPAGVLTWVDLRTASVTRQLSVATGFASNPHDYVEVSPTKAYVPRFEPNPASGQEPFDGGGDVLIVDPSVPEIVGRIDLTDTVNDSRYTLRADRAVLVDDRLVVLLGASTLDFVDTLPSRLAVIDVNTDVVTQVLVLDGMHACSAMAAAPKQDEIAVACSGNWGGDNTAELATSGVVRVALEPTLAEIERYPASSFGEGSVAFGIAYASHDVLAFTSFGRFAGVDGGALDDTLIQLDLGSGESETILRSTAEPFTLGDVRCDAACAVCLVTDAKRSGGVVHHLTMTDDGLGEHREIAIDDGIGLPPRSLGQF